VRWALVDGWEVVPTAPGTCADADGLRSLEREWLPAQVPGTAAGATGATGPEWRDFDDCDWWFRCRFDAPDRGDDEHVLLELGGIATVADVYLNGEPLLHSESMWDAHELDVTAVVAPENELAIACRALAPLLVARRRPRPRWRTRVVNDDALRWYRTMVFGRSPGFAPGPAPVGPWRPVALRTVTADGIDSLALRARLAGEDGVVSVSARSRGAPGEVAVVAGEHRALLSPAGGELLRGELRIPRPALWWPHTHGEPALHELTIEVDGRPVSSERVGFRSLAFAQRISEEGLDLHVNGTPVFARGAVWTPSDLVTMAPAEDELRALLERVRDAGMNMLRVVATGAYESALFHDLCDELGILVWQDLMFANVDYPVGDPEFASVVVAEASAVLDRLGGHPSLAVVCGNSEVEQQPAMLGLEPDLGRDPLWDETLARLVAEAGVDCAYIRSTPSGGELPFHVDRGVGHYFGVSGYMRPASDARAANVRFASECLAFANVPDEVDVPVHHPRWKAGVARDAGTGWDVGAGWDFDDVRDHYLAALFGVDPVQLRRSDHARYLDLSRAASGEVMAEVIGEWRRAGSPCRGALVLWLKDMLPGAGLGVLDHRGAPKVAFGYLRRAMGPVAVWTTDEGVNGVAIHIANDRGVPLRARLRLSLYRDLEARVADAEEQLELPAHGHAVRSVEGLIGHFIDAAWAYRFGPPAADAIFVTLESGDPADPLSQAVRFPGGLPRERAPAARLGLTATAAPTDDGTATVCLQTALLAYGVRVRAPGYVADDDSFSLEPGATRQVRLRPMTPNAPLSNAALSNATVSALNMHGTIRVR
jgi:beta-mannosidase